MCASAWPVWREVAAAPWAKPVLRVYCCSSSGPDLGRFCLGFCLGPTDERDALMAGKKPTKRASSKKRSSAGRTTRSTPKSVLPSVSVPNPATMVMNLDVLGNARGTLTSLTSVSGVKAVLERVGMFGPATIAAWTKIEAEHFGGAGMGAMMKALGVRGPTGPLAPAAALFLLNPFWMYAQF